MKVLFTPSARAQFLDAVAFIRDENPTAADALVDRASAALVRLREFPESGHALPEFPDLPHREVLVEPYRFFYRVGDDVVWIVAVWHGHQLPVEPDDAASG